MGTLHSIGNSHAVGDTLFVKDIPISVLMWIFERKWSGSKWLITVCFHRVHTQGRRNEFYLGVAQIIRKMKFCEFSKFLLYISPILGVAWPGCPGYPGSAAPANMYVISRVQSKQFPFSPYIILFLSLIHIWRCRRYSLCRSRWSPYH